MTDEGGIRVPPELAVPFRSIRVPRYIRGKPLRFKCYEKLGVAIANVRALRRESGDRMLSIKFPVMKADLIEAVKKQRAVHAEEYKAAMEGWRSRMMALGRELMDKGPKLAKFPRALRNSIEVPKSHDEDFAVAIQMLEMSVDDKIELDQDDYAQLVLGKWRWRDEWAMSNRAYIGGRSGTAEVPTSGGIREDELE